jgi:hypothetical protein
MILDAYRVVDMAATRTVLRFGLSCAIDGASLLFGGEEVGAGV